MFQRKLCAFSPCGELFVCVNDAGILTIWETATNNVKQEFDVKSHLKTACSSLIWGTFNINYIQNEDGKNEKQFIVIGTKAGEIYLYDYNVGKLYNHFNAGHNCDVNDLSLHCETNTLFSCSSDKSVIMWDTISGKINQQWTADDEEIYSISVVDSDSLLTGSTSIIWWNIKDRSVIKKFHCQGAPITILKVVNSLDVSSGSYFLCSSMGATKISAWSLNNKNCQKAVASFVINGEPQSLEGSNTFSKDNPLLLTAVTETGNLVLFKHVLNGKTKNLTPEMTVEVVSKPTSGEVLPSSVPILSSKVLDCAESCIIAYGNDDCPIFESVNIFDYPKKLTLAREKMLQEKVYDYFVPNVKLGKKFKENSVINGESCNDVSFSSPKRRKMVEKDIIETSSNDITRNINKISLDNRIVLNSSPTVKKKLKLSKKLERPKTPGSDIEEIVVPSDPSEVIATLLRGIEDENSSVINSVLKCDDFELIKASVKNFPQPRLSEILLEISKRLKFQDKRYNSSLRHWLKEIVSYHLPYLITCEDLRDVLNNISDLIDIRYITQTLSRMRLLKGLLQVQIRNSTDNGESSSCESDIEELVDS